MSGLGSGHTRYESKALYLNITIRSIRCHFGAVAVSALHPLDRAYLEAGRGLPPIDDVLLSDGPLDQHAIDADRGHHRLVDRTGALGKRGVQAHGEQHYDIHARGGGRLR